MTAVAASRHRAMLGTLGMALILAAIAALLLHESLLGGKVLTQADALDGIFKVRVRPEP